MSNKQPKVNEIILKLIGTYEKKNTLSLKLLKYPLTKSKIIQSQIKYNA